MDVTQQGLRVVVTDADTEEPIKGIPVSCRQLGSKWNDNAKSTNERGEVFFDLLPTSSAGMVFYSINYGAYFGYEQLNSLPAASVYLGRTTVRRHALKTKETVHEEPTTVASNMGDLDAPKPVPLPSGE